MSTLTPLISCICITANRPVLLQRSIACFNAQDYPMKELVISYPKNDADTKTLLKRIEKIFNIKMVKIERPEEEKLGIARNNALALANGEFICIWDDDDWFDATRISLQYRVLQNTPFKASILLDVLLYDTIRDKTYLCNDQELIGTLLCEKTMLLQISYLNLENREDIQISQYLTFKNVLFRITEMPHLYIYTYHGNNALGDRYYNLYFMFASLMEERVNTQIRYVTAPDQYAIK